MPDEFSVFFKNPLLHILCECYGSCLLLLETQIVQFVQLEKLALVFLSAPLEYRDGCSTHSSFPFPLPK
uniref:Uncharacterized protein n=1 Tax=Nothoprocta perdicaria TaxID=30464 RepID=A0A8C6Z1U7_NOTPE